MGKLSAVTAAAVVVATAVVAGSPATSYAGGQSSPERLGGSPATTRTGPLTQRSAPGVGRAAVGTALGLTTFSSIQADPSHGHVFVTGGTGTNGVVVLSTSGKKLETLGSTPGASGMTLSPDGQTLYVALANGDGIREIDTSTLTGTTVSTGADTCPQYVAVTAGTVWFGYTCEDGGGKVGSLDPTTGTVHTDVLSGFYDAPYLTASPALDGALFTGKPHQSPAQIARYDVTGGDTPSGTLVASREAGDNLGDFAVTPDGQDLIVASGAPYYHQVFSTADLSDDGSYTTSNYPDAVAINQDGQVVAGIDGIYSKDIWLFDAGATKPFKTVAFADGDYLQPRGLAFTGKSVFAVTGDFGGPFFLHVLSTKPDAPMKITTNANKLRYGAKARITVRLTTGDSHRHVSVFATQAGQSHAKLVKAGTLRHGRFTTTYSVTRTTMFSAVYAGGSKYEQTTKNHTVQVHAKVSLKPVHAYGKRGRYALFHTGKDPHWASVVAPNHRGGCVTMVAQYKTSGPWQTVSGSGVCVLLNAHSKGVGVLYGTHVAGEVVRVRAMWNTDGVNLKQKTHWSYARFTS
ncbi:MAG: hypothetical protein QM747_10650 [Nocardioides sp.]